MDDPVQPSAQKFREVYETSFRTWSAIHSAAITNPGLPQSCFSISQKQPRFPPNLKLKRDQDAKNGRVYATASTAWGSSQDNCEHGSPSFQQQVELPIAVKAPISLSAADEPEDDPSFASWFPHGDLRHLPALILAWAYILSARWTEVMSGPCSLAYTDSRAVGGGEHEGQCQRGGGAFAVDIGGVKVEEARWWAAVLAPGEGWQAGILVEHDRFLSPWSVSLQMPHYFLLSRTLTTSHLSSSPCAAASFSDAIRWLYKFCSRHDVFDLAHAALLAAVLFPSLGSRTIRLPTFRPRSLMQPAQDTTSAPCTPRPSRWPFADRNGFDRLLTLSCHTRGIRPLLLSVFYEPSIECNTVTPWFQGTISAIASLAGDRQDVLGRMLMERVPAVSPLWLGATVLGLQESLLQHLRYGMIPIDLHSAAWSGTVQSFLQLPASAPTTDSGLVLRADECRLLYLARSEDHMRVPVCQWKPFGETPVGDADVEVRMHRCHGHGLQYRAILWDCADGGVERQEPDTPVSWTSATLPPARGPPGLLRVSYEGLDYDKQQVSENTTRSILTWLRFDGHARHESGIWKHEWFDMLGDSDDEDGGYEDEESDGEGIKEVALGVQQWLFGVVR